MTQATTDKPAKTAADFVLPASIVSKLDLSRLVAEFEQIDAVLTTAAVRAQKGGQTTEKPTLSQQLVDFMTINKLAFGTDQERTQLLTQLHKLKDIVPIMHMTFAVEADRESLTYIAQWLRTSVHPQAVIAVGLQPGLIAGVYLRSVNKVYDMSLKAKLEASHGILVKELEALRGGK